MDLAEQMQVYMDVSSISPWGVIRGGLRQWLPAGATPLGRLALDNDNLVQVNRDDPLSVPIVTMLEDLFAAGWTGTAWHVL